MIILLAVYLFYSFQEIEIEKNKNIIIVYNESDYLFIDMSLENVLFNYYIYTNTSNSIKKNDKESFCELSNAFLHQEEGLEFEGFLFFNISDDAYVFKINCDNYKILATTYEKSYLLVWHMAADKTDYNFQKRCEYHLESNVMFQQNIINTFLQLLIEVHYTHKLLNHLWEKESEISQRMESVLKYRDSDYDENHNSSKNNKRLSFMQIQYSQNFEHIKYTNLLYQARISHYRNVRAILLKFKMMDLCYQYVEKNTAHSIRKSYIDIEKAERRRVDSYKLNKVDNRFCSNIISNQNYIELEYNTLVEESYVKTKSEHCCCAIC